MPVLEVRNLSIDIPTGDGELHAVRDVSFSVEAEEMFGIVGESGSGKSVLSQSIMGLLPNTARRGSILFEGRDLVTLPERQMRRLRGDRIAMISQDPLSALHPYFSVGQQICEAILAHRSLTRAEALKEAVDVLGLVGIREPEARVHDYPHQFSGGMRQRVMIAMAVALKPALLIADEPTTALDVTIQAQIIEMIDEMRRELGTAVIMVTHDLALLSSIADNAMVMYAGNRMETGTGAAVLGHPDHPYTQGLLASSPAHDTATGRLSSIPGQPPSLLESPAGCVFAPRCAAVMDRCRAERPPLRHGRGSDYLCWVEGGLSGTQETPAAKSVRPAGLAAAPEPEPVIDVADLRLTYHSGSFFGKAKTTEVLKGVNLTLRRGETLGIVGESGCGKSSLARIIAGLHAPSGGRVSILGRDMAEFGPDDWRSLRQNVQMVFQDPFGSLNPRRRVGAIIGDPFRIHGVCAGEERKARVRDLMDLVGLNPEHYNRFPSEFSGGQRQRIGIARALALQPKIVIFDEPVSALDVSIQAQILNLIQDLQIERDLSYLFISHDLSVVRHVSDRLMVMNAGEVVEEGTTAEIYERPRHPYTRQLLEAAMVGARAPASMQEASA
ncbi:ABC transporter ATP-binding protein [Roseicyclus sp. F158]|uniref:ABC transporter ATP-binding protein n=1 Tax=Tropicimonas omnivorans TaxID=3075590 RepID=A0ABU3DLV2_9RHOB|nr:ABC transporter ATP-binding protein [Roseicyclus sp. F158]MDT0684494.1 ABC transporter ATP-binding protein [Roseicyclus sp. F158]